MIIIRANWFSLLNFRRITLFPDKKPPAKYFNLDFQYTANIIGYLLSINNWGLYAELSL